MWIRIHGLVNQGNGFLCLKNYFCTYRLLGSVSFSSIKLGVHTAAHNFLFMNRLLLGMGSPVFGSYTASYTPTSCHKWPVQSVWWIFCINLMQLIWDVSLVSMATESLRNTAASKWRKKRLFFFNKSINVYLYSALHSQRLHITRQKYSYKKWVRGQE